MPLPPRLARMVVDAAAEGAGQRAAEIAAILSERGLGGNDVDLGHRLDQFAPRPLAPRRGCAADGEALGGRCSRRADARQRAADLCSGAASARSCRSPIRTASPRVAAANGAFLLANGRGANVDPASALAREPFLAVAELTGTAAQSRILLAAPITLAEIEPRFADHIERREDIGFDAASASLRGRRSERLGAITLAERPFAVDASDRRRRRMLAEGIAAARPRPAAVDANRCGSGATASCFCAGPKATNGRTCPTRRSPPTPTDWLAPLLDDKTALAAISADELGDARSARCCRGSSSAGSTPRRRRISRRRPARRCRSTTTREEGPKLAIRVQELFGLDRHPSIAGGRVPLVVELLSPAHRPVQVTRDLPGFWRGSYAAVKTEMRGRYPRHPWPDDPLKAPATRRAKPRGT